VCRCDERLQTKTKEFTRLTYTGLVVELEHLKIETRLIVETLEFCEFDGRVCDLEVIGSPSRLRLLRNAAVLSRIDETRDLSIEEKEEAARRKWNAGVPEKK
jgi:hypothetical protein